MLSTAVPVSVGSCRRRGYETAPFVFGQLARMRSEHYREDLILFIVQYDEKWDETNTHQHKCSFFFFFQHRPRRVSTSACIPTNSLLCLGAVVAAFVHQGSQLLLLLPLSCHTSSTRPACFARSCGGYIRSGTIKRASTFPK